MKELLVTTRKAYTEDGQPLTLRYFLLVEESPERLNTYGIKIIHDEANADSASPGLTQDAQGVFNLLDALANGMVTPTSLSDVIDDWRCV